MQPDVLECMDRIKAFQIGSGRKVASWLTPRKRVSRKILRLEEEGFRVSEGLRTLYTYFDGVDCGDDLNMFESNVFLHFDFPPVNQVVRLSLDAPGLNQANPKGWIKFCPSPFPALGKLELCGVPEDNDDRVHVTFRPFSQRTYVAFENIGTMLASVVRAHEAGLLTYDLDGRIDYSFSALADLTRDLNPSANYWDALANKTLDWGVEGMKVPDFGRSAWG